MNQAKIPLILDADDVANLLGGDGIVIVDLSNEAIYESGHIPGAVHIDAADLFAARPPVMGLLPPEAAISDLLSAAGIRPDHHVIAYDGENTLKACRFLWTLDVIGHRGFSLLNGGLNAWVDAGHPLEDEPAEVTPGDYPVSYDASRIADRDYILAHLENPDVIVLDARTELEYNGVDRRAARGGHIPGARNLDWARTIIGGGDLRFRPVDEVRALYFHENVTSDKEVIVHCQTHMRSCHSFILLKALGFERIRGYPGSWSDWGNDPALPVEH